MPPDRASEGWRDAALLLDMTLAAEDALLAVQQREDAGEQLTPTFVQLKLDQQSELADAALREATAISDYNIAIAQLEQAKGTLLRYNNIIMEETADDLTKGWARK